MENFFTKKAEEHSEWYANHEGMLKSIGEDALKSVIDMNLPITYEIPDNIEVLGQQANNIYRRNLKNIVEHFGKMSPSLFAYAQWSMMYACWSGAHWFNRARAEGIVLDNEYTRRMGTPQGYGENEGKSWTTFDQFQTFSSDVEFKEIASILGFETRPDDYYAMHALEMYWQNEACRLSVGSLEFFAAIQESKSADSLACGLFMWNECEKGFKEGIENGDLDLIAPARRSMAKFAASARHASTNEVRSALVERYKKERGNYSSKDAAAISYTKDYPYEFQTIRNWLKNV